MTGCCSVTTRALEMSLSSVQVYNPVVVVVVAVAVPWKGHSTSAYSFAMRHKP
jgi:hypothetical protein